MPSLVLGNSSLMQVNDNKQEYEPLSTKCLKSKKVSALVYKSLVRKKVKLQGIAKKMAYGLQLFEQ